MPAQPRNCHEYHWQRYDGELPTHVHDNSSSAHSAFFLWLDQPCNDVPHVAFVAATSQSMTDDQCGCVAGHRGVICWSKVKPAGNELHMLESALRASQSSTVRHSQVCTERKRVARRGDPRYTPLVPDLINLAEVADHGVHRLQVSATCKRCSRDIGKPDSGRDPG